MRIAFSIIACALLACCAIQSPQAGPVGFRLSSGFKPSQIPGLLLWLDASQIAGLNDGDSVTTWNDLSGNGKHLTQTSSTIKPTYNTSGGPGVLFDGVDDYMENLSLGAGYAPEVFVRCSILTYNASGILFCDPDNGYGYGTYAQGSGNIGPADSSGTILATLSFPLNTTGVLRCYFARAVGSNAAKTAINGSEVSFTIVAGAYTAANFGKISLGRYPSGGHYQNAKVRQVLIYSSPLTAAQRLQVEAYLSSLP